MKTFLECLNENPDFLNYYLKYEQYIYQLSKTTINEMYYDIRTFFRYLIYLNSQNEYKNITPNEFREIAIKDITLNDLNLVTSSIINDYIGFLRNFLRNCPKTRNRKLATLKNLFKYLYKNNLIYRNPAQNVTFGSIEKRNPKYLNITESKKLLSVTIKSDQRNSLRNYAIICLFLNCCLRLSELISIDIDDIDFSEKTIKILGKGNKERIVYMNKAVIEAIKAYLKIRPKLPLTNVDNKALFLSEQNKRISRRSVQLITEQNLKKALEKDKQTIKGYHTHTLRHTGATLMYDINNTNILLIQEILGHDRLTSTEIYTHVSNHKLKEIMETASVSTLINKYGGNENNE